MTYDIKLVGLDLDGTLLTTDHRITDRTREAIARATASGCLVVPATGRPLKGVPQEFLDIPGVDWAVTANGATVTDLTGREQPWHFWIPVEDWFRVKELLKDLDPVQDLFVNGCGYNSEKMMETVEEWAPLGLAPYMRKSRRSVPDLDAFARTLDKIEKANLFFQDPQARLEAKRRLDKAGFFAVTSSAPNNWELNAVGVNKGRALLALGERLGLRKEQVMACGDSGNDEVMLRTVGLGVAMGNASEAIKKAADRVTASNDEDGVAKAIEKYVLGECNG